MHDDSRLVRADGWYSDNGGLTWHHPAPNAAAPTASPFCGTVTINRNTLPPANTETDVERVARVIDPDAWASELPIPTRADTISFHSRRQLSIVAARRAISTLSLTRTAGGEEVDKLVEEVRERLCSDPFFGPNHPDRLLGERIAAALTPTEGSGS